MGEIGTVPKQKLKDHVEASQCDIRLALNGLQMSLLSQKIGGTTTDKDGTLILFRALGKFLYSKRLEEKCEGSGRGALAFDLEEVIEKSAVEPDTFTLFLHHNYPTFFVANMDFLARTANDFSFSDSLLRNWQSSSLMKTDYLSGISGRSVAFNNAPTEKKKWQPMYRPQFRDIFWQTAKTERNLSEHFCDSGLSPSVLVTELLPYSRILIDSFRFDSEKCWQVARQLVQFKLAPSDTGQLMEEAEFVSDDDASNSQWTSRVPVEEKAETSERNQFIDPSDLVIEEFSDSD